MGKKSELRAKLKELESALAAKGEASKKAAPAQPAKKGHPILRFLFLAFLAAAIYYTCTLIAAQNAVAR